MKTSDLIKQAEELLSKCAKGPFDKHETWSGISVSSPERGRTYYMSQVCMCSKQGHLKHYADSHADLIVFARNHMQELIDRVKEIESAARHCLSVHEDAACSCSGCVELGKTLRKDARKALED